MLGDADFADAVAGGFYPSTDGENPHRALHPMAASRQKAEDGSGANYLYKTFTHLEDLLDE